MSNKNKYLTLTEIQSISNVVAASRGLTLAEVASISEHPLKKVRRTFKIRDYLIGDVMLVSCIAVSMHTLSKEEWFVSAGLNGYDVNKKMDERPTIDQKNKSRLIGILRMAANLTYDSSLKTQDITGIIKRLEERIDVTLDGYHNFKIDPSFEKSILETIGFLSIGLIFRNALSNNLVSEYDGALRYARESYGPLD